MSLLRKTLLVVVSTVILSTLGIYLASQSTLLHGYEKIEQDDTKANVLRIVNSYYDQSKGIVISDRAYAVWDDMYDFIQEPKQEFLDYLGLTPELFATHQVNLIAILDPNYKTLFIKMYDLETAAPLKIPSNFSTYLQPGSPLLQHTTENPEISGVILLDGKPMYVASLASLHTDFTGEPRGAIIFGRYLDDKVIAKLSTTSQLAVSAYLPDTKNLPKDVSEAIVRLKSEAESVYVKNLDQNTVAGYTYIKTLESQPAFLLKATLPRRIYAEGMTSFNYFTVLTALAGLVFIIVSTLLLREFVLLPLTNLSRQVSAIRASGDNSQRLIVRGQDELSSLGHAINEMLAVLESRTHELELAKQEIERSSEERYRNLVENINDVIFSLDQEGHFTYISPVIERITAYTVDEVLNHPFSFFVHPDDLPSLEANLYRTMTGTSDSFEFRALHKNGKTLYVRTHCRPMLENGNFAGLTGVMTDITLHKLAEEALRESEQKFRAFIEQCTEGFVMSDEQGLIIEWNQAQEKISGLKRSEVLGKQIWDTSHHPGASEQEQSLALRNTVLGALKTGVSFVFDTQVESVILLPDGSKKFIEQSIFPIRTEKGFRIGAITSDVSERKEAEQEVQRLNAELEQRVIERTAQLEAVNKELETFSYSVSHDLRAPLRAIDGFTRIVIEDFGEQLEQAGKNYLLQARENAHRMSQLIDDLLAFSRLSRQSLNKQPVQPNQIVRQVLEELQPDYAERQMDISVADLPACVADPSMLHQVFMNLIENAIKYTSRREKAEIEIGWQKEKGKIVYSVKDNGAGFDMQYANKLFAVFQRLHRADEFSGTGIGLATTQRIIQRHGGHIWASAEVDKGATFYFTL